MSSKTYEVYWTGAAQRDLRGIIDYIARDSVDKAKTVYADLKEKAADLRHLPLKGRVVPELRYFGILVYRELIVSPWRIIYKVEERRVWVLAVFDSRRNVEDILLDRLLEQ